VTRDERGTVTVFVTVFMIALVFVAGLVIDGGNMLAARREASNVAESAARAGAQALDESFARSGDGVHLNPTAARHRAEDYLTSGGFNGTVSVSNDTVVVEVSITQRLFILGVGGLADTTVTARGQARSASGVLKEGD